MLIETIRSAILDHRRSAQLNPIHKAHAATLSCVVAEATKQTKNPNDEETMKALRAVQSGVQTMHDARPTPASTAELELLEKWIPSYLPKAKVAEAMAGMDLAYEMRNIREFTARLQELFPGQIEGRLVAEIVKEAA